MTRPKKITGSIINRTAKRDFDIKRIYQVGIVLIGAEVKSLRKGHGHLKGAFVNFKDGELWLFNATITATNTNRNALNEERYTAPRKLLLKTKEIKELKDAKEQGLTIVPLKILTNKKFIKVEIATARGLKKYDKRAKVKLREARRQIKNALTI